MPLPPPPPRAAEQGRSGASGRPPAAAAAARASGAAPASSASRGHRSTALAAACSGGAPFPPAPASPTRRWAGCPPGRCLPICLCRQLVAAERDKVVAALLLGKRQGFPEGLVEAIGVVVRQPYRIRSSESVARAVGHQLRQELDRGLAGQHRSCGRDAPRHRHLPRPPARKVDKKGQHLLVREQLPPTQKAAIKADPRFRRRSQPIWRVTLSSLWPSPRLEAPPRATMSEGSRNNYSTQEQECRGAEGSSSRDRESCNGTETQRNYSTLLAVAAARRFSDVPDIVRCERDAGQGCLGGSALKSTTGVQVACAKAPLSAATAPTKKLQTQFRTSDRGLGLGVGLRKWRSLSRVSGDRGASCPCC